MALSKILKLAKSIGSAEALPIGKATDERKILYKPFNELLELYIKL